MSGLRLALAGGGTGGHIVPGLHLLECMRAAERPVADVLWFQSGRAVEQRVMARFVERGGEAAIDVCALPIEPPGGGAPSRARLALRLPRAVAAARAALRRHETEVLLGLGGFTGVPAVLAARSLRIPVALLEVNTTRGAATRWLAPLARLVLHTWPATLPEGTSASSERGKHRLTGPPIGPTFTPPPDPAASRARAKAGLGFDAQRPLLLILGGSQGAGALNTFASEHLGRLEGVQVLHQVGPGRAGESGTERAGYQPVEYVDDVPGALVAADLVLCRGGASTLAEVAAVGTPAWVVPYPHHPDRHQERNAQQLGGGVRIVPEAELGAGLVTTVRAFLDSGSESERMRQALREACPAGGGDRVAALLFDLAAGARKLGSSRR